MEDPISEEIFKSMYGKLRTLRYTIADMHSLSTKAIDASRNVIEILSVLEDKYSFNFNRTTHFARIEEVSAYQNDLIAWKEDALQYVNEGLRFIVDRLVEAESPSGFKYFFQLYKEIFDNSARLESSLKTNQDILRDIKDKRDNISNTLMQAESEKQEISDLLTEIKTTESKAKELDKTVTELNNSVTLFENIKQFEEWGGHYGKKADHWLYASIGAAAFLITAIFFFICRTDVFTQISNSMSSMFNDGFNRDTVSTVLYIAIAKSILIRIFFLSMLVYLLSICIKNYKNNMHNCVISRHKSASLVSALKLVDNTAKPAVHEFILASAAAAIFSHQETGFGEKEKNNNPDNPLTLGKILSSIASAKNGKETD